MPSSVHTRSALVRASAAVAAALVLGATAVAGAADDRASGAAAANEREHPPAAAPPSAPVAPRSVVAAPEPFPPAVRRRGFYFDFYSGLESHMDPDTVVVDLPEFKANSHATSLFELDFGYTLELGLSLGLGFELVNFVAPNMKIDIKHSFSTSELLQPYVYVCMHGGIVHLYPLAVHGGGGIDYFISDRVYLSADLRAGWELVRVDPAVEQHLEAALSLGFGVRLSGFDG